MRHLLSAFAIFAIAVTSVSHVKAGSHRNTQDIVDTALAACHEDERGQWILSAAHQDAASEYALTRKAGEQVQHMIVDRTFIDDNGERWIIDYKTGSHTGAGLDVFLDREQERYRSQLENYASAFSKLEDRPIRLGLYFPLLKGWREWRYQE